MALDLEVLILIPGASHSAVLEVMAWWSQQNDIILFTPSMSLEIHSKTESVMWHNSGRAQSPPRISFCVLINLWKICFQCLSFLFKSNMSRKSLSASIVSWSVALDLNYGMLVVIQTWVEWGGGSLPPSDTEMTAHSSRERNRFKVWQQQDWLTEVVANSGQKRERLSQLIKSEMEKDRIVFLIEASLVGL